MKNQIKQIYRRYQFNDYDINKSDILAFYHGGYFQNIDLVPVAETVSREAMEKVSADLSRSGFSCRINGFRDIEQIERDLFRGFFNIEQRKSTILADYSLFSEKISKIVNGSYQYIPSACKVIKNDLIELKTKNAVEIALSEIIIDGPQLVIIDAPAGYGKTTVIYELAHQIIKNKEADALPLIAELHRNRKVSEFRYVLLSEFDRIFGGISYELAISKIQSGDLILIIDGFDEMIMSGKKSKHDDDESEPLLQSLMGIIRNKAKVILTSRRTALIDTDLFRRWVQTARNEFHVTHISIQEPMLDDWLPPKKIHALSNNGIDPSAVSNPVILSNLRNMGDLEFNESIKSIDRIVDIFLEKLLTREIERQELKITPIEQRKIFRDLAWRFAELHITEEQRSFVEDLIKLDNIEILEKSRVLTTESGKQMTLDEYMSKLSIHALLDGKSNSDSVCFVNEFFFGYFLADYILQPNQQNTFVDEGYLDLISSSMSSCCDAVRGRLSTALSECLEIADINAGIRFDLRINRAIARDIHGAYFENMEFEIDELGQHRCATATFRNCSFYDVTFTGANIASTTFYNCNFWNCKWDGEISAVFHGCNWEPKSESGEPIEDFGDIDPCDIKKDILERFWPQGRPNFTSRKKATTLHKGITIQLRDQFEEALSELCRERILIHDDKESYILNIESLQEIKGILGR